MKDIAMDSNSVIYYSFENYVTSNMRVIVFDSLASGSFNATYRLVMGGDKSKPRAAVFVN